MLIGVGLGIGAAHTLAQLGLAAAVGATAALLAHAWQRRVNAAHSPGAA